MTKRIVALLIAAVFTVLGAVGALADTLHLKDGRVLEGRIEREGDDFVFFILSVGGVEHSQLFLRSDIEKIERSEAGDRAPVSPRERAERERRERERAVSSGAVKIAFITLGDPPHDMVGPYMNADALEESIKRIEPDDPDIVVLRINSGGGALSEVMRLVDTIQKQIKPKYRVVVWVESAISAAAMTGICVEEIYFMRRGNFGAATGFRVINGQMDAIKGEELEEVLRDMERVSGYGNYNPLIMRAMQTEMELSCDIDENGRVTWHDNLTGQHVVSTRDRILTFNALDAVKYHFAKGIADSKDELAALLQAKEWVEVGKAGDAYQREFRANVARAEVEIGKLFQQMQIALNAGQYARARQFLGQLRGWARRAPSWTEYPAGGFPPLSPEVFREIERQIEDIRRRSAGR